MELKPRISKGLPVIFAVVVLGHSGCSNEASTPLDGEHSQDAGPGPDMGSLASSPTYYQDVAPILQAKCVTCHSAGKIAPFSLDTPEAAKTYAAAIKQVVDSKTMPPWPPGPLSPAMQHARSLSELQITMLTTWVDAKAPLGDAKNPAPPGIADVNEIGASDLSVDIGADYTADKSLTDDYRCFLIDLGTKEDRVITGYRITPGNSKTVHHVVTSLFSASDKAGLEALDANTAGPGWSCFGGSVPSNSGLKPDGSLASWVPGSSSVILPKGTGTLLHAGDLAVMQIHYNVHADAGPDRTKTELQFAQRNEEASLQQLAIIRLAKADLALPANQSNIKQEKTMTAAAWTSGKLSGDRKANLVMVAGHMHTLGTHLTLERKNSQGTTVLLDIPAWDFHWQGTYTLAQPISIAGTDELTIRCVYENTAAQRQANDWEPAPVVDVAWGEGTHDEMCIGYLTVVKL